MSLCSTKPQEVTGGGWGPARGVTLPGLLFTQSQHGLFGDIPPATVLSVGCSSLPRKMMDGSRDGLVELSVLGDAAGARCVPKTRSLVTPPCQHHPSLEGPGLPRSHLGVTSWIGLVLCPQDCAGHGQGMALRPVVARGTGHTPRWDSSAAQVTSAVTSSVPTAPGPEGEGLVVPRCPQKMCDIGVPEPPSRERTSSGCIPTTPHAGRETEARGPSRQAEPPPRSSGASPTPIPPSSPGSAADSRLHTGTAAGTAAREATKMI